jgi:FkbM family methyltransferase
MDKHTLLAKLEKSESLAKASVFSRLEHHPLRYLKGMWMSKFAFPFWKGSSKVPARTFFGADMRIALPAGLDVWLCHAKTHDSEIRLARYLIKTIEKGMTFLDIGAHYGYFSLLCAHMGAKVVSVEAATSLLPLLTENLGDFEGTTLLHAAVSDRDGQLTFYEFEGSYSEYNSFSVEAYLHQKWFKDHPPKEIVVPCQTVETLCRALDLYPDIIKIDVEGAEEMVIRGARHALSTGQPVVVMEYLSGNGASPHSKAARLLRDWNYRPHIISPDGSIEACEDIEQSLRMRGLDSDNLVFKKG